MLITWISHLDSIPNINILRYLPSFLEELFLLLEDVNKDIRMAADNCLLEFLKEIKDSINRPTEMDNDIIIILV